MLARGESVAGGLGKKLDVIAAMKTESITTRQISRIVLLTQLTEEELSSVVRNARVAEAHDRAIDREVRRRRRSQRRRRRGAGPPAEAGLTSLPVAGQGAGQLHSYWTRQL